MWEWDGDGGAREVQEGPGAAAGDDGAGQRGGGGEAAKAPKNTRRITFSLFKYQHNEREARLLEWATHNCRYIIAGREVCPRTQEHHLQCYAVLRKVRNFGAVLRELRQVLACGEDGAAFWVSPSRGSSSENKTYCSKDEDFWEWGDCPGDGGDRTDLDWCAERLRAHRFWEDAIIDPELTSCIARYRNWAVEQQAYGARLHARKCAADRGFPALYEWQRDLLNEIEQEPHERRISFIVDPRGGGGKSSFARWLALTRDDTELHKVAGDIKPSDVAFKLQGKRVQLFDCSRDAGRVPYALVETIKDGYVFSPKYACIDKIFPIPFVFVFMNQDPDREALSADRYEIVYIPQRE